MSKKIIIDPVTRIEGHLRVEVELDENNIVTDSWVSGQLFRGIETILQNRDPRDTGLIAQRICGVCTNAHYRGSISAVEDAYNITPPTNAMLIRNLVSLSLFIQDHIVHYYHLHSLDFVDVVSALSADIDKAVEEAHKYHPKPFLSSAGHLEYVKEKLTGFVNAGRLGLFANGYWGHEAYKFTPEQNLIHMNHYLEALKIQREVSKAIAIFGGKTPHPQNLVVGGVTSVADMLNPQRLNDFIFILRETRDFIERAYIPDMKMLVSAYKEDMTSQKGKGVANFLSSGGYSFGKGEELFERGIVYDFDLSRVGEFDDTKITEEASRSWYVEDKPLHPYEGKTEVEYTDLNEDGSLKGEGKYSWIKAPRYDGKPMEVGPLARMIVGYASDSKIIKPYIEDFLSEANIKIEDMFSSVGRNVARGLEARICADYIFDFVSDLIENIKYYDEETWSKYNFDTLPTSTKGRGIYEVPRGTLSHFVRIEDAKVANYQAVVPTTWNASPKDSNGIAGSYEQALIGLEIKDSSSPLEVLRVIHSFDPCIACAVHIVDTKGKELSRYKSKNVSF